MNGSGSRETLSQQSQVPSVRTFQIDPGGLGGIAESVNLFRGAVTTPLRLASITGRNGLEAWATLLYLGPAPDEIETRNLDAPSGPLGTGWRMGYEFIALDDRSIGAPGGRDYYLVADGMSRRLLRTAVTAEYEEFELEQYEFWRIRHHPAEERWVIVRESGDQYVYGGRTSDLTTSPVQYGVKWGGPRGSWRGSSTQTSGQHRFPIAWNLAEIRNPWGDAILFGYENDLEVVGTSAGLAYTRASRLASVGAPFGRVLSYRYREKVHNASIREYQIPHVDPKRPEFHAFQDRYDTRYLDSVELRNAPDAPSGGGELLLTIGFEYELRDLARGQDPDFYKRYLTAVTMTTGEGLELPGYTFEYHDDPSSDGSVLGALKSITYPQGGTVTYGYERTALTGTSRSLDIVPSGVPRVWFGPDYTVVATLDGVRRGLGVSIYSWTGEWVSATRTYTLSQDVDLETLQVSAEREFFALSFKSTGSNPRLYTALFHKRYGRRGDWFMDEDLTVLPIDNGDQGIVAAGQEFVVTLASGGHLRARVWDPVAKAWQDRLPLNVDRNASYALAAGRDYFALASFQRGTRRVILDLQRFDDENLRFQPMDLQVKALNGVLWDESSTPEQFWSTGADYAVMTYATRSEGERLDYKVVIQQWGEDLTARVGLDKSYSVTTAEDLAFLRSVAGEAVVGNVENLFRFDGVRWVEGKLPLPPPGAQPRRFVYGSDVAIVSGTGGAALAAFDPFNGTWSVVRRTTADNLGIAPTAGGDFVSMGRSVLYRNPNGEFVEIFTLPSLMVSESMTNRAPAFLAYQDTGNSTNIVPLANGKADGAAAIRLANERIVTSGRSGTALVGPSAFMTFTGQSFDRPVKLTLHHYLDEQVTGPVVRSPVSSLRIDDGMPSPWDGGGASDVGVRYSYDCDHVSVSPDGSTVEFAAATAVYGVAETAPGSVRYPAPEKTPFGRSEFRFHNDRSPRTMGLVHDDALLGSAAVYYSYLNGMLYDQTDYDADGEPVERVMNLYTVGTEIESLDGRPHPIVGGYVRPSAVEASQYEKVIEVSAHPDALSNAVPPELVAAYAARGVDVGKGRLVAAPVPGRWRLYPDPDRPKYLPVSSDGDRLTASVAVSRTVSYEYSRATGLLVSDRTGGHDSRGRPVTFRREVYYGWQVPGYHALADAHIWSPVVLSIRFHRFDDDPSERPVGEPVEFALTTLKEWPGGTPGAVTLAPCRTYTAVSADVYDPSRPVPVRFDDWDNTAEAEPAGWRRTGEVLSRNRHGAVLEAVDVQGAPSCNILNATETQRLAQFSEARLGEVSYQGFEEYESEGGWSLSDGSDLWANVVEGDAHTGFRSLRLAAGSPSLRRSFSLRGDGTPYILSYWVKTLAGFSGDATWSVDGPDGSIAVFPIADTGGEWSYRHHVVHLGSGANGSVDVTVSATGGSAGGLLLDDILFTPLPSTAEAVVFHPRFGDSVAAVAPSGATNRTIHDSYRRVAGGVKTSGTVASALALSLARHRGAGTSFSEAPNLLVEVQPQTGGVLVDLTQGDGWIREWSGADPARWTTRGGRLVHTGSGEDTITFTPSEGLDDYGVRVSVHLPQAEDGTPVQPGLPLGVAIGDDLLALWDPADGWSVTVAGDTTVLGGQAEVATDWMLLAPKDPVSGRTSVFFYADGRQLFARLDTPAVEGPVRLRCGDPGLGFSGIATLAGPTLAVTYLDGAAREIQKQAFDGTATVVAATVHDPIGRACLGVKATRLPGPPGYRPEFVRSFDPVTGVMTGQASDENPEDKGYPYVRTAFRRTAQSLPDRQGMPGVQFAIREDTAHQDGNPHARRIDYGTNTAGEFGRDPWPSGQYFVTRITDPNGDLSYTVTGKTGDKVGFARGSAGTGGLEVAWFDYDRAGRMTRVIPPAGVEAFRRGDPDWEDWASVAEYSYAGELVAWTAPDSGTARYVYDRTGAVRFGLTAEGTGQDGADDTITYTKYDPRGRVIEEGFFTGRWDRAFLEEKALTSPGWPDATQAHTVTLRNTYDGDGSSPALFGRLVSTETWRADGTPTSRERFDYDLVGNVTAKSITAYDFDDEERAVSYTYDNLSNPTGIDYPAGSVIPRIVNGYDRLGRLYQVGTPDDPACYGSFRYNAQGELTSASTPLGATRTLQSLFSYNPPGWPLGTRHELDDGSLVLEQSLTYTEAGYQGAGYFDGRVASVRTTDGVSDQIYRYEYDGMSRITVAESTPAPDECFGVKAAYDPDGNFTTLARRQRQETYAYRPVSNQVTEVTVGDQKIDGYAYDRNGAVTKGERLGIDRISYHPVTGLPLDLEMKAQLSERSSRERVRLSYDGGRQRAVKRHEDAAGAELSARLYVRGAQPLSVFEEIRTKAGKRSVQYVYGPEGLTALLLGDKRYTVVRDHLGSPRRVVDETGAVVAAYDYATFGATITRPGTSEPDILVYRYTGQEWDAETGLYNYRARLYDPVLGRFYDIDPAARGSSPYVYVENNPANMVDPDGEAPFLAFLVAVAVSAIAGAVIGAVTYAISHQGGFDVGKFFLYAAVGAVSGAIGGAAGYGASLLATAGLIAAGVSTSTSIASGVVVGAATGAADGVVSAMLNQVGVNLIERRPAGEGVGLAAGMGIGIGAALGALAGGVTGRLHRSTAARLVLDPSEVDAPGMLSSQSGVRFRNRMREQIKGMFVHRYTRAQAGASTPLLEEFSGWTVAVLGGGSSQSSGIGFGSPTVWADAIADSLRGKGGLSGISLLSSYAGSNGVARTLASRLNVPVRATSAPVAIASFNPGAPLSVWEGILRGSSFRTYYPSSFKTGWIALFGY